MQGRRRNKNPRYLEDVSIRILRWSGFGGLVQTLVPAQDDTEKKFESDALAEAQAVFPNVVVARDFDTFQVRRGEVVKMGKQKAEKAGRSAGEVEE